jgi:general secretion pathway protein F
MKTFAYRGFDRSGRGARGLIEALDLKEAREKLSARGVLAERVDPASGGSVSGTRVLPFGLDVRAVFYRELAALVRAGLPVVPALDILIQTPDQQAQSGLLAAVRDRVREGATLSQALAESSPLITPFERAVLTSGVRAGNLEVVLDQLGGYLDDQVRLREGVQSAMLYPLLVIALALLIGIGMLGFVLPSLTRMFAEGNIPIPALTRGLLWISSHTFTVGVPVLLALLGALLLLRQRIQRDRAFGIRVEQGLDRIPWVRKGLRLLAVLRFARTLALLVRGGVPLVDALDLAGDATGSRWISAEIRRGAEEARHGRPVAQVVRAVPPLSDSLPGWFQAGEASGDLAGLLEQAARRFQMQWETYLNRMLKLVEPLLILAVGIFVLLIALAILLPILSLNQSVL